MLGLHLDDLEHADRYLRAGGKPCFGYYNEFDVVRNRPPRTFLHCIYVCGDPRSRQVLGYAEYFGYQKIVACLSENYIGKSFSSCYAIDPISGTELDLVIHLDLSQRDIKAIYEYKKVDLEKVRANVGVLVEAYLERVRRKAVAHAIDDALEYAFVNCGAREGEVISDERADEFISLVLDKLVPAIAQQSFNSRLDAEDIQKIAEFEMRRAKPTGSE